MAFITVCRYGSGTLTKVFVDRVFQECLTYDGEMVGNIIIMCTIPKIEIEPKSSLYQTSSNQRLGSAFYRICIDNGKLWRKDRKLWFNMHSLK